MNLRLILGDQLNPAHPWFQSTHADVTYLLAEVRSETDYVSHHVQKVCAIFRSMERFADWLEGAGHRVRYLTLDDTAAHADFPSLIRHLLETDPFDSFDYQRPDEYRLLSQFRALEFPGVTVTEHDTHHFLVPFEELAKTFPVDRNLRMETFYRRMRKQHDILMDGNEPAGGQWNFDVANRSKLKAADLDQIPVPQAFSTDVADILQRLQRHDVRTIGSIGQALDWPTTPAEAREQLVHFCESALPAFGTFQDAMTDQHDQAWLLFHSRLSFAMNIKMLHPREVIDAAIHAYQSRPDISIEQVEGFVRQILGWREFIRGIYWTRMPDYQSLNALAADRPLPDFYWTGETRMNCMRQAISQSLERAYAHHIQRLMITGNFAMLAGLDPDAVDAWYLGIYADAFEWVELPNTRGMSQFADGGIVGSKAYAASANYINKQSDYCRSCDYMAAGKTGQDACPFNSLYWDFMIRHRESMERNPRIGMVYRNWDRQDAESRDLILQRAAWCLAHINEL
ncbi:MAG: cryptochrome/photolyase family protein [Proteobacteria bacterium]|nr:cryptochrome/photolyase family protein [Pseudomonadota bacterium]